jgi:hypothetical protein
LVRVREIKSAEESLRWIGSGYIYKDLNTIPKQSFISFPYREGSNKKTSHCSSNKNNSESKQKSSTIAILKISSNLAG